MWVEVMTHEVEYWVRGVVFMGLGALGIVGFGPLRVWAIRRHMDFLSLFSHDFGQFIEKRKEGKRIVFS